MLFMQNIPTGFCKKYLPPGYYKFILENTEGGKWEASSTPCNATIQLGDGWIGFARDNGVKIGDDCLFELESKSKTVVHIIKK